MEDKADKLEHIIFFSIPNIIGILIYLPLLLAVLMGFGAPGAGKKLSHWLFGFLNIWLGPLCLIGLISRKHRHLGWVGFGLVILSFFVIGAFG